MDDMEPYLMIFRTNIFRLIGDFSHLFAMFVLLFKIFKTKSCTGISGRTQILLALVFLTRYSDIFTFYLSIYNTSMKAIFIACTVITVILIYGPYRHTYDRKYELDRIEFLILPAFTMAMNFNYAFEWLEVAWTFSIYLEAIAIVPQLFMTYRTGYTKYMMLYLTLLGIYRSFYILNWIFRYHFQNHFDGISFYSGVLQTFILLSFLWITSCSKLVNVEKSDEETAGEEFTKPNPLSFALDENTRAMMIQYIQNKRENLKSAVKKGLKKANSNNDIDVKVHSNKNAQNESEQKLIA